MFDELDFQCLNTRQETTINKQKRKQFQMFFNSIQLEKQKYILSETMICEFSSITKNDARPTGQKI